jgi:hypothetical protein
VIAAVRDPVTTWQATGWALRQRGGACAAGVLLMNPWSGGGKVARFGLVTEAQRRGVRALVLGEGDDLVELAEQAVREGADVPGMAGGGDGPQALLADVARRHDLGLIRVGSMVVTPPG